MSSAALLMAVLPPAAGAQQRWAVVAVGVSEDESARARELAASASAALASEHQDVVDDARVRARLDAELAAPFVAAPAELVERVTRASEAVLDEVSFGRNERAIALGEPVLTELQPHVTALGRLGAGTDVGHLCLYLVRAELQRGRAAEADGLLTQCLRLVPDLLADERLHPPAVRELLTRQRAALADGSAGGILSITAGDGEPEGCAIRVQGRVLGRTPWIREPLPEGRYDVQIECTEGAPGRVAAADVQTAAVTRITVPVRLLASLGTREHTSLAYASETARDQRIATDVATIARLVDVDCVLVVMPQLLRGYEVGVDTAARMVGSATLTELTDAALTSGVRAVLHGEAPEAAASAEHRPGGDVAVAALGSSLLTVGVASLGIGWYFWSEVDARGQDLNRAVSSTALTDTQRAFDDARTPVLIAGLVGGALSLAGASLLTTQTDEAVPWWTWVFGAAALGVGAVGVYLITTDGACYGNPAVAPCARRSPTWLVGSLVLSHAAMLLAVPVTAWLRALVGVDAVPNIAVDQTSVQGLLGGSF